MSDAGSSNPATSGFPPGLESIVSQSDRIFIENTLYIGDIPSQTTVAELRDLVKPFGRTLKLRFLSSTEAGKQPYANVTFREREHAAACLEQLNYSLLHGSPIRVTWYSDKALIQNQRANVVVKGFCPTIDARGLHEIMASFGPVLTCKISSASNVGTIGWVQYRSEEVAAEACNGLDGVLVDGRFISVKPFVPIEERLREPKAEDESNDDTYTRLLVKQLSTTVTHETLGRYFSRFGTVERSSCRLLPNGQCTGIGFVNFTDHAEATKAAAATNGKVVPELSRIIGIGGEQAALVVARPQNTKERQRVLASQREYDPSVSVFVVRHPWKHSFEPSASTAVEPRTTSVISTNPSQKNESIPCLAITARCAKCPSDGTRQACPVVLHLSRLRTSRRGWLPTTR